MILEYDECGQTLGKNKKFISLSFLLDSGSDIIIIDIVSNHNYYTSIVSLDKNNIFSGLW